MSSSARAQSAEELATRRLWIEQATAAANAGDHARALDLAERADRVQSTPSVRLFIASRQEALGRFVASLGSADQCVRSATRDERTPNRAQVLEQCTAIANRVRARVAVLELRVTPESAASAVAITLNGNAINTAHLGAPQYADPGTIVLRATARGYQPWERSIELASGSTTPVVIELRPTVANTDTHADANANRTPPPSELPRPPRFETRGPGPAPWILAGAGALVMGSAGIFAALRGAALDGCVVGNDEIVCRDAAAAQRVRDSAYTHTTLVNVTLAAGGAMVLGGVLWFALAPRRRVSIDVLPTNTATTVLVSGRF